MTASPGAPDPIVTAVAEDLDEWTGRLTLPEIREFTRQAVEAHRRAVLEQRDDGPVARIRRQYEERRRLITQRVNFGNASIATTDEDVTTLLAALADAEIARRQAEADVQRLRQSHEDCDRTYADLTADRDELLDELRAEQAGLPEWSCPRCGAVTRARMADHPGDAASRPRP